jgi:hypothetical membrane protein
MEAGRPTAGWALYRKIAGLCGVLSPFLGLALVGVSIYYHPTFSWTENYLSLLGVEGPARASFNASLIVDAVLAIAFAVGFATTLSSRRRLGRLGIAVLILGACAMSFVGIFPRTCGAPHTYASVFFFALVPLGLFIIGAAQLASSRVASGLFTFACGILMVVLQLIPWPWGDKAISQLLAGLPWSLWLFVFGLRLLRAPAGPAGESQLTAPPQTP